MKPIVLLILLVVFTNCKQKQNKELTDNQSYINEVNSIASLIKNGEENFKIKSLISDKNVNVLDSMGYSFLSLAIRAKNENLVKILLDKGANPNLQNDDFLKSTPLMQCSNYNLVEVAKYLIEKGADVNIQDKQNDPVIHWTAYYGEYELTKLLLDNKAKTNLKSIHSDGVMHVALKEWQDSIVDLLMSYNVKLNNVSKEQYEIVQAVKANSLKNLKRTLKSNLVNSKDASGTPILITAASNGNLDIVKYLLQNGADINNMNPVGHTALNRAVFFGNEEMAHFLIAQGADVAKTDDRFMLPPLIAAIRKNRNELAKVLIEKGASINALDGINGMTPIMWAAGYENKEIVKLLLINNADLSIVSKYDNTVFTITSNKEIQEILNNFK